MAGLDSIRKAFSKGTIVMNDGNVSAVYADHDWVTQSFGGEDKDVFSVLVNASKRVTLRMRQGSSVRIGFISNDDGRTAVYYEPIEREISSEEIEKIINDGEPTEEFQELIDSAHLYSDDELREKLAVLFDRALAFESRKIYEFEKVVLWPEIKERASKFSKKYACSLSILEPDSDSDGSVTIHVPVIYTRPIVVDDGGKELLSELIDLCSLVDLEMNPSEGYINIVLYP